MKDHTIDYYTINSKILPLIGNSENRYRQVMNNWLQRGYRIKTKHDNGHYYTLVKLDKIDPDTSYGIITKFVDLEGIDFINRETGELIAYPIPSNVAGKVNDYEFLFFPKYHRFALIKSGKIDESIKKAGAPLKKMAEIIEMAFDAGLDAGSNQKAVVEIVQDSFIFEEIFRSELYNLTIKVSYTNDDINDEAKEAMDSLLKDGGIVEFYAKLEAGKHRTINTDETLPNGLLQLAQENGTFKATIRTEEGHIKKINSVNYPAIEGVTESKGSGFFVKIIEKIIQNFNKKYGSKNQVENES